MGFVGDVTDNGRHALRLWQSGDYALLLTDLHMPEMDGYELVARIRAEENGRCRVPIVALSANVLEREIDRCRNAGMDDYLSKPVRMADLKGLLKKWLPETCCDAVEHVATLYTVVDLNVLADSVGNDPEVIQDFLGEFKITAVNIAATMNAAWVQGSTAQVAAQAHKLKSSARAIGALALSELCDQVERAGRLDDRCALATLLPAFVQEFSRVGDFLDMT